MADLVNMADPPTREIWNNMTLGYTESQGLPALRHEIVQANYTKLTPDQIIVLAPEEGIYLTMRALLRMEIIIMFLFHFISNNNDVQNQMTT